MRQEDLTIEMYSIKPLSDTVIVFMEKASTVKQFFDIQVSNKQTIINNVFESIDRSLIIFERNKIAVPRLLEELPRYKSENRH